MKKYIFSTILVLTIAGCGKPHPMYEEALQERQTQNVLQGNDQKHTNANTQAYAFGESLDSIKIEGIEQEEETPEIHFTEVKETFFVEDIKYDIEKYLPILMFHHIEKVDPESHDQIHYKNSLSPDRFEQFLQYFQENNIQTLTFEDIYQVAVGNTTLPEKAVILTFDDGYTNHYDAFVLLQKYNMKGVFFIISEKPDRDPWYLTWNQIQEMSAAGHEIGSHTVNHPNLASLSLAQIRAQLLDSKETIQKRIGKQVITLCYPAGSYDSRVVRIAREVGYFYGRTINNGKIFNSQKPYHIPATRVWPETGMNSLRIWFEG